MTLRTLTRELRFHWWIPLVVWLYLGAFTPARGQHCQVHVDGDGSLGSGTLIDTDSTSGLVLTCGHMVRDSKQGVWVSFPGDQRRYNAKIVAEDQDNDLCALVIGRPNVQPARVSPNQPASPLTACGFGGNQGFRSFAGQIVGQTSAQGSTAPSLIIQGSVRPGDSGGGVFNSNGELVGVVWGQAGGQTYLTAGEPLRVLLTQCCPGGQCYSGQSYRVITQPVQPVQPQQPNPGTVTTSEELQQKWLAYINNQIDIKLEGKGCECDHSDCMTLDMTETLIANAIAKIKLPECPPPLDADKLTLQITNALSQKFEQRFVTIEQKLNQQPAPPAEQAGPQIFSYDIVPRQQ